MRNKHVIVIIGAVFLISCGKEQTNLTKSVETRVNIPAESALIDPYQVVIEKSLALQFDYLNIPQGVVEMRDEPFFQYLAVNQHTVNSPISEIVGYAKFLHDRQNDDFITIEQITNLNMYFTPEQVQYITVYSNNPTDFRLFYLVKLSQKALNLQDTKNSDSDWCRIAMGQCKIKTVMSDNDEGNNFRSVVGTYDLLPTDLGKEHGLLSKTFKFRAVIKSNPFNQTFSCAAVDYGEINADANIWMTQNAPAILPVLNFR